MTGGYRSGVNALSSTEQLVKGGGSWTIKENSLPARMHGLGTISINNQIFTTGKANILNKTLLIYQIHYFFYFQEDMMQIPVLSQIRYCFGMKRQQPSKRLANWNKEDVIIQ